MSVLAARIRQVLVHVNGLRQERDQLASTRSSLMEEVREAKRRADVLQVRIMELEQENEVLRSVDVASTPTDRAGSKERIDELVNEIDRCLALLKN